MGALRTTHPRETLVDIPAFDMVLPGETLICPGRGPLMTVDQERANNPFF